MENLQLQGSLKAAKSSGKLQRITIVASTGQPMNIAGMGRVLIDLHGLTLTASTVLLDGHINSTEFVVGQGQASVIDNRLIISGTLSDNAAGNRVLALLRAGVNLEASIGIAVTESEHIAGGTEITANGKTFTAEGREGLTFVTSGTLRETSILPNGADELTSVNLAAKAAEIKGMEDMKEKDAVIAERKRIKQIQAHADGGHSAIVEAAIDGNWTAEKAELEILRAKNAKQELTTLRADRSDLPGMHMQVVDGAPIGDVMTAGILQHCGKADVAKAHLSEQACGQAKALKARSVLSLVEKSLALTGHNVPASTNELLTAGVSLVDLSESLGNSANLVSLTSYQHANASWKNWVRKTSASDFKTNTLIRSVHSGGYPKIAPGGIIKHSSLSEETDTLKLDSRGTMLRVDRRDIVNDSLGTFISAAQQLGEAASKAIARDVYETLLANLSSDGTTPFFSANNMNLETGGDSALSLDAVSTALTTFRNQLDGNLDVLDIAPKILLVPSSLASTALQIVKSLTVARHTESGIDNMPMGNPHQDTLTVVVEPRLESDSYDNSSATQWYILAGPEPHGAGVMAYLDGNENPVVEIMENQEANTLGHVYRSYFDWAFILQDYRTALRNNGV